MTDKDDKFHVIFQTLGIAIAEFDIERLLIELNKIRKKGISNIEPYLTENPELLQQLPELIVPVEINDENIFIFEAANKNEIMTSFSKTILPETASHLIKAIDSIYKGNSSFEGETVYQTLKGKKIHVINRHTFLYEEKRMIGSLFDISERKQAELNLLESEKRYQDLYNNAHDFIYTRTPDGVFLSVNNAVKEILGYEPQELIGQKVEKVVSKSSIVPINGIKRIDDHSQRFIDELYHKDGSIRWFESSIWLREVDGKEPEIQGIARDITTRVISEQRLRTLERAVNNASNLMVIMDYSGEILFVNKKFSEVFQSNQRDLIGKNAKILFNEYVVNISDSSLVTEFLRTNETWLGELCIKREGMEDYWGSTVISPIVNQDNVISHYIGVVED
ncbi:MAG: PAS domain-containing protein, partial [Candidatus Kariarchaeaceae archaeon]